jgi:hypothetical protein
LLAKLGPFDGFVEYAKRVSPTCLVHLERNRYSVPASFANCPVSVRLYPERIVVVAEGQIVCEHRRVFARSHERKSANRFTTGGTIWRSFNASLRNGAPFAELPPAFRALQQRMLKTPGGDREMVEILALVIQHDEQAVLAAVVANCPVSVRLDPERIVVVAEGQIVCEHRRVFAGSHERIDGPIGVERLEGRVGAHQCEATLVDGLGQSHKFEMRRRSRSVGAADNRHRFCLPEKYRSLGPVVGRDEFGRLEIGDHPLKTDVERFQPLHAAKAAMPIRHPLAGDGAESDDDCAHQRYRRERLDERETGDPPVSCDIALASRFHFA